MKKSDIPMTKMRKQIPVSSLHFNNQSIEPDTESEYFDFSSMASTQNSFRLPNSKNSQVSVTPYTKPQNPIQIIYVKNGTHYIHDPDRCPCDKCQMGRRCKIM